ncbi:hypothetical protein GCM10008018_48570 [Paenibacillus marchantiophytorum]|uniref:Gfo/Idh/MocA-like oxidoreductase C-terminal domain-containing protein n=1 Tax=Paenibacillus marchantiophytorum TaxID=1619310 RepID=A0ABQ1F1J3_9BACL|nr:hypothetical protein [Paenibacillus marchantiophytorum]GFZ96474.1 hypothetical protein GCM10008018_48570 [Paenibacillus marchantiophytorum]
MYGENKSVLIQYDTPLPTTLHISETKGDTFDLSTVRPTYKDAYVYELEYFHEVVSQGRPPKTTPEDYLQDLIIFKMIMEAIQR